MTIITPIALDHADYLGNTTADIAHEKAGIIEPGSSVISADQEESVLSVIRRQCILGNNSLKLYGSDFSASRNPDGSLDYSGLYKELKVLVPGIPGRYQIRNAALALAAAEMLDSSGTPIPDLALRQGLAAAYWPGRMELIAGTPPLLLDGAHNPAGAEALAEALTDYQRNRILLVTGVCSDKDMEGIYAPLLPLLERVYTVTPAVERSLKDLDLANFFRAKGYAATPCGSVAAGINAARDEALPGDLILVCGSLFVVGEAKAWLENVDFSGIRG